MPEFLALDGEGWDGKYTLLASRKGAIENPEGLSTLDCLSFLLGLAKRNPGAIAIGFGISYDVNMMLRDLPDESILELLTEDVNRTIYQGYEITYYPKKIFEVKKDRAKFTWYDVFSFFGTSFVGALRKFLPQHPKLEEIALGKARRGSFTAADLPMMRSYNEAELEALEDLAGKLAELFESQGIYLSRWHGPGALASYLLSPEGYDIIEDFPRYRPSSIPQELANVWDCAFFGGRIENILTGTVRDVHSYDINSAYPYAASLLPRHLPSRFWRVANTRRLLDFPLSVYRCSWDLPKGRIGPFPFRDRHGLISFPLAGRGWYFRPEVATALAMFPRNVRIDQVWYQDQDELGKMSKLIPALYQARQRLKLLSDPAEYVIKLALNSIYGKFAQRKGKPQYRCPAYAGFITSQTRAQLLGSSRAAGVLAFATDSIFTQDNPDVPQGLDLGQWKREDFNTFTCIQNGFYRLDDRFHSKQANRGIPKVDFNQLLDELERTGQAIVTDRVFVTHQMALAFPYELGKYRLRFVERTKIIKPFATTKRVSDVKALSSWLTEHTMSKPPRYAPEAESYPIGV